MKFEWDKNKNISNKDKRKNYSEQRFIAIGKIVNSIITVVFTLRDGSIRIISARPAKKQERNLYNNQF